MNLSEIGVIAGISGTVLAAIGGIVTIIYGIIKLKFERRLEASKQEAIKCQEKHGDLKAKFDQLMQEVSVSKIIGTEALLLKTNIDKELTMLKDHVEAGSASIYIPYPSPEGSQPEGLIFLSMLSVRHSKTLRRSLLPLTSIAGKCFLSGEIKITNDASKDSDHYKVLDDSGGYKTRDMICFPLIENNKTIGVLQFINKLGESPFSSSDKDKIYPFVPAITQNVRRFLSNPNNIEILGIVKKDRDRQEATIMCCDLTHSSVFFQEMDTPQAIQHVNEYLDLVCEVGLGYGGTIDKYIGDSVMLTFNVPMLLASHGNVAMEAAIDINNRFTELKRDWLAIGKDVSTVFSKVAIASGPVHHAMIGHPQKQALTCFGPAVNISMCGSGKSLNDKVSDSPKRLQSAGLHGARPTLYHLKIYHYPMCLCGAAPREQNVIIFDESIKPIIPSHLIIRDATDVGKAVKFIDKAYYVESSDELTV